MATAPLSNLLLIGAGGALGSIFRYLVGNFVQRFVPESGFPYGTLAVNVIGCLTIGILGGLNESRAFISVDLRHFLFVGVLGGFTTFSTFGYESVGLLRAGHTGTAFFHLCLHVFLGLGSAWVGFILTHGTSSR